MALGDYAANRTGLLLVDPYNDLLSDGGKLWPRAKAVAEAVDLLTHLRVLVEAARRISVAATTRLVMSDQVETAFTFDALAPAIVLPVKLNTSPSLGRRWNQGWLRRPMPAPMRP